MPFRPRDAFSEAATHSVNPETQHALYRLQQCVCWPRGSLWGRAASWAAALAALGGVHEVALDLSPLPQQHRVEAECCWTRGAFRRGKNHLGQLAHNEWGGPQACERSRTHVVSDAVVWCWARGEGWTHLEIAGTARRARAIDVVATTAMPANRVSDLARSA